MCIEDKHIVTDLGIQSSLMVAVKNHERPTLLFSQNNCDAFQAPNWFVCVLSILY